jgi:hypothetical protein
VIYYLVNNKIIYNRYLAEYESYQSKKSITLKFFDELYDQFDWSKEPESSFDDLMDAHARALREKYDVLILSWSGGTDSHTIYNVFARNRIHIDEIFTRYYPDRYYITAAHVDWLRKNHWDPTTKIRAYDLTLNTRQNDVYLDEDWIFKNFKNNMRFTWCSNSSVYHDAWEEEYGDKKWANIGGFERPFVMEIDNKWYYYMSDLIASYIQFGPNYENFYLDPLLNIKQAHLLKRFYQRLNEGSSHLSWENFNWGIQKISNPMEYRIFSRSYGRHDELQIGSSFAQKTSAVDASQTVIDPGQSAENIFVPTGHGEARLLDGIKRDDPQAMGYASGLANLASNPGFYQHLNEKVFRVPNKPLGLKAIHSKYRYLGQ